MIINLNVLFFFLFFLLNNLNMLSWFIKDVLISNHIGCHKLSQQMELGSGKGSGHIFCSNLHLDVMSTMAQYSTLVMNNDMYSPQQELFSRPLGSSSLQRVRLSFSLDWVLALSLSHRTFQLSASVRTSSSWLPYPMFGLSLCGFPVPILWVFGANRGRCLKLSRCRSSPLLL